MSTAFLPSDRLVLSGATWQTYERVLRAFDDRHLRVTFDRGSLEIMTLSHEHESYSYLLGRIVDTVTEELGLPVGGGKSTTFKRRKKQRGLEPDNCFWITNEPAVRGKARIDLKVDPPPDLTIEVDISHSTLNRMGIYESLRVPEVWVFHGEVLSFHVLQADGTYKIQGSSRTFPNLHADDVARFLALRAEQDANSIIRQFRAWLRKRIAASWE